MWISSLFLGIERWYYHFLFFLEKFKKTFGEKNVVPIFFLLIMFLIYKKIIDETVNFLFTYDCVLISDYDNK